MTPRLAQPNRSRTLSRRRLFALLVVVSLLFSAVVMRLTQLQVLTSQRYETIGETQRIRSVKLSPDRGGIFDRNGNDLAQSLPQQTIWADPRAVEDPYRTAALLAPVLGQDIAVLQEKLRKNNAFVYLQRKASDEVAAKVKALDLAGISMYEEPKRFLPGEGLLSSVLGQVGIDNEGLSGLELQYEKQLKGQPGQMVAEQDPSGRDIPGGLRQQVAPRRGDDLVLTIDRDLQFKVEEALREEITLANARGGIAAMMDTKTGEVLALANLQVPNGKRGAPVESAPNNAALTNVYEPGSTSKLITISAALESGIVNPSTRFSIGNTIKVADGVFGEAEQHPVENWTVTDILAASSNVGTITIAQKLGKERLDKYQRAFGYGSSTGLQFPGESKGLMLDPKKYSGTSLATMAIGQGVSTTAMQMLAAYNTIANGGVYVAPKLLKSTIDADGKEHATPASNTTPVVSPTTAKQMNLMLQEVVRVGTATSAQIEGYEVAGKTGTARKPRTDGPGYESGAYVSSFIGFVPASAPRLTALVLLDQPTPIFGGLVAAPVFSDITRYALQSYGIRPSPSATDRVGVPLASSSAGGAADESGAAVGISAADAKAITANVNRPSSGSSSTSTTTAGSSTAGSTSSSTKGSTKPAPTTTSAVKSR